MKKIFIAGYAHGHTEEFFIQCADKVQVVGVNCVTAEFMEHIMQAHSRVPVYDEEIQDVFSVVDCDIVGIGDAYGRHGALAVAALRAGKHVIADKPLCTSLSEANEIRRLAKEKHLSVGLMLPLWSHPNTVAAQRLVHAGKLGEIQGVNVTAHHPLNYGTRPSWYWEKGMHGGTINDIAAHGIDVVEYVTGLTFGEPKYARCWNQNFPQVPHFDNGAQFVSMLSNGAGVTGDISYFAPCFGLPSYWRFTFWGKRGWMEYNLATPGVQLVEKDGSVQHIFPETGKDTYWTSFMDEISGKKPGYFTTEHVLDVTETTLKLQQLAMNSH